MTGEVIGSPEFLAPERALGRTPGPESDLWSLGVLLYAAVEGNSPFRQDTPLSTLRAIVDEELPPAHRAGPLTPVIEGLLRKDPAERLPADRAEHDLRIIAAGGTPSGGDTPRTDGMQASPYAPTVAAFPQPQGPTPPMPYPSAQPQPGKTQPAPAPAAAPPQRNRRAAAVLVTGLVVLALALAGLTYALLNRDNGNGNASGNNTRSESGTSQKPSTTEPGGGAGSPTPSPSSSRTTAPQSVQVALVGANTDYAGACPPPSGQAPAFTATFTVGRLPAEVSYRWVSKDGQIMDPGWKTMSFPEGGTKTKQDRAFVTTHNSTGTFRNSISVQVRSPKQTTSNSVPFSVTCVAETPTGGASPSSSPSPSQ
jgi:hypothetical protein